VSSTPNAHLRLPTLTDEVHLEVGPPAEGADGQGGFPPPGAAPGGEGVRHEDLAPLQRLAPGDEEELVRRVLAELQRHVDLTLEYRLREALVPTLARISDMLIRETRVELADTLHQIVARAVAQELSRRGSR
jgi:hypothetical protein